jgi:small conductance mechanosensitive channel
MADPVTPAAETAPLIPQHIVDMLIGYGQNIGFALLTLVIGWMLANWLGSFVGKRLDKITKGDLTLSNILGRAARVTALILTFIVVLGRFGVQTASLVAVLGAAGLAIGLALQGTLSNVAAGVMLLFFRSFKIGDVIDADCAIGKVRDIGLFITQLDTPDNVRVIIPNSRLWGNQIKNIVANPTRRCDMVFSISYSDDMELAKTIAREIVTADARVLKEPAPMIVIGQLGESSVDLFVRPWVNTPEFWDVKFTLIQAIKKAFDERGLTIPFPQRDVHLYQAAPKG